MIGESRFLDVEHICRVKQRPDPLDEHMPWVKKCVLRAVMISKRHPNHNKYLECENDFLFEKKRHISSKVWFVMHPFSLASSVWELFILFVYIIDSINFPNGYIFPYSSFTLPFMNLNIVKQFFTAYIDKQTSETVFDLHLIAKHYAKGWFVLDFLGAFPFHTLIVGIAKISGYELTDEKYHLMGLYILHTLNLRLMLKSARHSLDYLHFNPSLDGAVFFVLCAFFVINWMTCLLLYIPRCIYGNHIASESWLKTPPGEGRTPPIEAPNVELYARCLLRAMSLLLSITSMDARTPDDMYIMAAYVMLGRVMFYITLNHVMVMCNWLMSPRHKYLVMMNNVEGFMRRSNQPIHIREKVMLFFSRRYGGTYFYEQQLLPLLSASLRQELRQHEFSALVRNSKFLSLLSPEVVADAVETLDQDFYLPNDVILRANTYGDVIYLLASGTVAVISRNGYELAHLVDGDFFGEMEAIMQEKNLCNVIAVEVCEVYRMEREVFNRVVRTSPEIWEHVRNVVSSRNSDTTFLEKFFTRASLKGKIPPESLSSRPSEGVNDAAEHFH